MIGVAALAGACGSAAAVVLARRAVSVDARRRAHALGSSGRHLPARVRVPLTRALDEAGLAVTPEEAARSWLLGTLGGLSGAAVVAPGLLPLALLAALAGPPVALHLARGRLHRRRVLAVPEILEGVAAELRGGGTVVEGIEAAARSSGHALGADLEEILRRLGLGARLPAALATWSASRPLPGVREASGALSVAAGLGGRAAGALEGLAASLRARIDVVDEARALSAQARLSAVVVGAAPLAYLAFSSLVDRRALRVLVGTTAGRLCLLLGVGLEVIAGLWMARLVRAVER